MQDKASRKKNIISFCICILYALFELVFVAYKYDCVFLTNDDEMLLNIASGAFTGTPAAGLVYIMSPIGLLLKVLYTAIPGVEHYSILMLFFLYLSLIFTAYRVVRCTKKIGAGIIISLTIVSIYSLLTLSFFVNEQYTFTAAMLVSTALLYLSMVRDNEKKYFDGIVIIVFYVLALLVRKQIFFLSIPIALLIVLPDCVKMYIGKNKQLIKYYAIIFAGIFAGATVAFISDYIAYSTDEWREYKSYNKSREIIYDYNGVKSYEELQEEYEQIGVSKDEIGLIINYDLLLDDSIDANKLEAISNVEREAVTAQKRRDISVKQSVFNVFKLQYEHAGLMLFVLIIVTALSAYSALKNKNNMQLFFTQLMICYIFAIAYYLTYKGRFPDRVYLSLYLMSIVAVFGKLVDNDDKLDMTNLHPSISTSLTLVPAVCLYILLALFVIKEVKDDNNRLILNVSDWEELNEYCNNNTDKLYMLETNAFPEGCGRMFKRGKYANNMIRLGSWMLNSPYQRQQLDNLEITSVKAALVNEGTYIIASPTLPNDWIVSYMTEDVCVEECGSINLSSGRSFKTIKVTATGD